MADILHREFVYLWFYFTVLFEQIFRYWVVGILIGSVISVFGKRRITEWFGSLQGRPIGLLGILPASILGILSPLCMYGTIPIAASFSRAGMKDDWLAAFMMGSILLNPQLLIYSAVLGTTALAVRFISALLGGIAAGLLIHVFYTRKERDFFNFEGLQEPGSRDTASNPFIRLLKNILRNIRATGPYFLLGITLTAAFQRYVPNDLVANLFGSNEAFGVLTAAALGVPLYACGGGTIPLLYDWMLQGMSMGSAAAFMVSGPATKLTNLGALKVILGSRRFLLYIVFLIAFAFSIGTFVNLAV